MEFTLTKTPVKGGKYEYEVFDKKGKLISRRLSKRDYVACTTDGYYFFGRLDLIGKGEHGKRLNDARRRLAKVQEKPDSVYRDYTRFACQGKADCTQEEYIAHETRVYEGWITSLTEIAYLKNEQA